MGALRCFQGIDTVSAVTLVAELHDFSRFRSARELMAYLGLVPSENSSSWSRSLRSTSTGFNLARLTMSVGIIRTAKSVANLLRADRASEPCLPVQVGSLVAHPIFPVVQRNPPIWVGDLDLSGSVVFVAIVSLEMIHKDAWKAVPTRIGLQEPEDIV